MPRLTVEDLKKITVGNALEVREAIETLTPNVPHHPRFYALCLRLAGETLHLCGLAPTVEACIEQARQRLNAGDALDKFRHLIEAQGGNPKVIENPHLLPSAPYTAEVLTSELGYIHTIHSRKVAYTALKLGAGRQKKENSIDPAVSIEIFKSVGDRVERGEPLFRVHARTQQQLNEAVAELETAYQISSTAVPPLEVVLERKE